MRIRLARSAAAVLLTLGLPAVSAAAPNREHLQLMADLRMLQEQAQQLQLAVSTLSDALKAVNARIEEQAGMERKAFADQKLLIDTLMNELRIMREKSDDTNVRISTLSQELEALRASFTSAQSSAAVPPPTPGVAEPAPAGTPDAAASGPSAAPSMAGLSPQKTFDQAKADFAAGAWALAIAGFDGFLKAFPKSDLADDAQYYMGESYSLDGKFSEALAAYDAVIQNYPAGDKVPEALYKRGIVLDRMGQTARARESFETIVKKYPATDVALLAKQALERVNRGVR